MVIKTYKCPKCKDVFIANSEEHHKMNWCKCGECAVDLESYCERHIGDVIELGKT